MPKRKVPTTPKMPDCPHCTASSQRWQDLLVGVLRAVAKAKEGEHLAVAAWAALGKAVFPWVEVRQDVPPDLFDPHPSDDTIAWARRFREHPSKLALDQGRPPVATYQAGLLLLVHSVVWGFVRSLETRDAEYPAALVAELKEKWPTLLQLVSRIPTCANNLGDDARCPGDAILNQWAATNPSEKRLALHISTFLFFGPGKERTMANRLTEAYKMYPSFPKGAASIATISAGSVTDAVRRKAVFDDTLLLYPVDRPAIR